MCPKCKRGYLYVVVQGSTYVIYGCTNCSYRKTVVYRRQR